MTVDHLFRDLIAPMAPRTSRTSTEARQTAQATDASRGDARAYPWNANAEISNEKRFGSMGLVSDDGKVLRSMKTCAKEVFEKNGGQIPGGDALAKAIGIAVGQNAKEQFQTFKIPQHYVTMPGFKDVVHAAMLCHQVALTRTQILALPSLCPVSCYK